MFCVEISAKQGMLIFWLHKHLVYGLSEIVTALASAQGISGCTSVRASGTPPVVPVPAWPPLRLYLLLPRSQLGWWDGLWLPGPAPTDPPIWDSLLPLAPGSPPISVLQGEKCRCFYHRPGMFFPFSCTWKQHLSGSLPEKINLMGNTCDIRF